MRHWIFVPRSARLKSNKFPAENWRSRKALHQFEDDNRNLSCKGLKMRLDECRIASIGCLSKRFGVRMLHDCFWQSFWKGHVGNGQRDLCHHGVGDDMMRLAIHSDTCACATRKIECPSIRNAWHEFCFCPNCAKHAIEMQVSIVALNHNPSHNFHVSFR